MEPALARAARYGDLNLVNELLARNANVHELHNGGFSALRCAVIYGHTNVVKRLLDSHADVHEKHEDNGSLLCDAVLHDCMDVAKLLLDVGLNACETDDRNGTPLHLAAAVSSCEMIRLLVKNNADVNQPNGSGNYPLSSAICSFHFDIRRISTLLELKADLNADVNGYTPMHTAVQYGTPECITLLLDSRADVFSKHAERMGTPFHTAGIFGCPPTLRLMKAHLYDSKTWMRNPNALSHFPQVVQEQLRLLARLWSSRSSQETLVSMLPLELLHVLLDTLTQEYLIDVLKEG